MMTELHILEQEADRLLDALTECPDETTEVWGAAETWPSWCDDFVVALGRALVPDELLPDDPDWIPVTDAATLLELRQVERTPWQDFLAGFAEVSQ